MKTPSGILNLVAKRASTTTKSIQFRSISSSLRSRFPESSDSADSAGKESGTAKTNEKTSEGKKEKSMAELDDELRMKMEGRSGDGGEAGRELEGGKAVGLKRGVRENMFRVI